MLIASLMLIIFSARACSIWRAAPELWPGNDTSGEVLSYRYATTPLRHYVVATGSCLLFAVLMTLVTYALAFFLWYGSIFDWLPREFEVKLLFFLATTGIIVALISQCQVQRLLVEACLFFQRYQFFPPLPSGREQSLVRRLNRLPPGTLPSGVQAVLNGGGEARFHQLQADLSKLEQVHDLLQSLAAQQRGLTKVLYFGREWELIHNQYLVIKESLRKPSAVSDCRLLAEKVGICLFYGCHLLTRFVLETSASSTEVKKRFDELGVGIEV